MRVVICSIGAVSDFAGAWGAAAGAVGVAVFGVSEMPSAVDASSGMKWRVAGLEVASK